MSALESWRLLVAHANGRAVVGAVGIRDPEFPCEGYQPTESPDLLGLRVTAPGGGSCDSDGHYLCVGCRNLSDQGLAERISETGIASKLSTGL